MANENRALVHAFQGDDPLTTASDQVALDRSRFQELIRQKAYAKVENALAHGVELSPDPFGLDSGMRTILATSQNGPDLIAELDNLADVTRNTSRLFNEPVMKESYGPVASESAKSSEGEGEAAEVHALASALSAIMEKDRRSRNEPHIQSGYRCRYTTFGYEYGRTISQKAIRKHGLKNMLRRLAGQGNFAFYADCLDGIESKEAEISAALE